MSITATPYARRSLNTKGSFLRELLETAQRPGMVFLAGGHPAASLFDVEGIRAAFDEAFTGSPAAALQYGPSSGAPGLREMVAAIVEERGARAGGQDIVITTGSQQGIDLVARVLLDAGDTIAIERPTYLNAIQTFGMYEPRFAQVETDEGGTDVDALEDVFRQHRPKLFYCCPTFSNPSGAVLSIERRQRIVELAHQYRVLVLEDDPYHDLRFGPEKVPTMLQVAEEYDMGQDHVAYLSSFSKTLSPGLRLGFMVLPTELRNRVIVAKQACDLHTSSLSQAIAERYIASGRLPSQVERIRSAYAERAGHLIAALKSDFAPGRLQFVAPRGGMFVWAQAKGIDTLALVDKAIELGVVYVPGHVFYAAAPETDRLRLSFATADNESIALGSSRLSRALT